MQAVEQKTVPKATGRRRKWWQAALGLFLLCAAIWAAWFLTSDGFRDVMRWRLVSRIEEATGGRAEVGALRWNLSRMEFEADDVTVHGLEAAGERPFLHVDRIFARVKVKSFFAREVDFEYLGITHPAVNLIVYPDGTTNQPVPKAKKTPRAPAEQLIELAIGKLELQQGELFFNQQRIPIGFDANNLAFRTTFDAGAKRYEGSIELGRAEIMFGGWRPVPIRADLHFSLFPDHALIHKLAVASGRSQLEAYGSVSDFKHLSADLTYKSEIDLRELAAAARIRNLNRGTFSLQGAMHLAQANSTSSGTIKFRDLGYYDGDIRLSGISGESKYTADSERLQLTGISGRGLDGSATGSAEIQNWTTARRQSGKVDLRVEGVQLRSVAAAASTKSLPLNELHFAGATNGTVRLSWQGSIDDSEADLALRVLPPVSVEAGQVPVTADLRGTFFHSSQTLQIGSLNLATPETTVVAKGAFSSLRSQMQITLRSNDVRETRSFVDALRGPSSSKVELNGSAFFNGTVSGRLAMPSVAGHIELRDFTTVVPVGASGAEGVGVAKTRPVQWDSLTGELRYSPDQLSLAHATLLHGRAQISLDATSSLQRGIFTDNSAFTIRTNVHGADLGEVQAILGYGYPVSGQLDTNLQISGTRSSMRGGGHLQLSNAVAYGEPIRSVGADLQMNDSELQLSNVVAAGAVGEVTGSGSYNTQNSAFRFTLHSDGIRLANLQTLQKKQIAVQGTASFDATGSGTSDEPNIAASLHLRDLVFGGERAGAIEVQAVTKGDELNLSAVSNFENAFLQLTGTVRLRDDLQTRLSLNFRNVDIDPVVRAYLKQFRMTSHTLMTGHAGMNGPLRDSRRIEAAGQVDSLSAGIENVKVANKGPILFSFAGQVVGFENLHLVGEGTDFTAGGKIGLTGARDLDMHADGRVNMRVLQSFGQEFTSSGLTTINLNMRGTLQKPRLRGRIQITDGAISYVDLPNGLSAINGTMVFTEDRLQVQKLTAHTGGGDLDIGGFITYSNGLTFNLTAKGKDIRLRYPPGVSASGDADLTLAGTPKNSLLSGEITVTRFGLNPKFDFATYLAKSKQPQAPVKPDSPVNTMRLDIHVASTPELQLETSLAKVTGNVDLHLRGTAARPVLLGKLNIFEGDIVFNSTTYHLERGEISFSNPAQIQPVLDVEASAHVRDYDITLGFHGPADRPSITYRSDPPLPTADIIALLALGRTREDSATAQMYNPRQTTLSESDENALLGQALNATVSSRVQRLFGVSRIKIDPQVGGAENNANARLTIEQQVSNKITITYITNLSQSAQQIIQVEWNITRDLALQGSRDQTGVLAFDVRIRQRKK